jgi:hypothetical protein
MVIITKGGGFAKDLISWWPRTEWMVAAAEILPVLWVRN